MTDGPTDVPKDGVSEELLGRLAEEVAAVYGVGRVRTTELSDGGRLASRLEGAGARVVRASQYGDRFDLASQEQVLDENTTEAFWSSGAFVVAPSASFESGPFASRCLVVSGPSSTADLLRRARGRLGREVFDGDAVVLARPGGQLLVSTHYGTVLLLEPGPRAAGV